jgi:hypothetical protein
MAVPTTHKTAHWIGGEQVDAGAERIEVVDPATAETHTEVPAAGTATDVDRAVAAAHAAFAGWSTTLVEERGAVVQRVSNGVKARRDEIAGTFTAEMGSPITFAQIAAEVSSPPLLECSGVTLLRLGWRRVTLPRPGRWRDRRQRRRVQPARAVRRLQAERQRSRARALRAGGVPRSQVHPAVGTTDSPTVPPVG